MKISREVVIFMAVICGLVMKDGEPTETPTPEVVEAFKAESPHTGVVARKLTLDFTDTLSLEQISEEDEKDVVIASSSNNLGTPIGEFTITAYDLSEECCSKTREDPNFGLTASGFSLVGMSREEAMTVAVDPSVIPLGSKLYIKFEEPYAHFSGEYVARDTGGLIKGHKIDLFMGDFGLRTAHKSAIEFGVRKAEVYLIGN